jgi:sortase (surface protein transpeptidase)
MKSDRKNNRSKQQKQKQKRTQKKMNKSHSRKSHKRQSRKSRKSKKRQTGGECEYLKVQGFDLPDLKIPEQYALLNESCQPSTGGVSSEGVLHGHPNMTT